MQRLRRKAVPDPAAASQTTKSDRAPPPELTRLAALSKTAPATLQLARLARNAGGGPPIQRVIADPDWEEIKSGTSENVHVEVDFAKQPPPAKPVKVLIRYIPGAAANDPPQAQYRTGKRWIDLPDPNLLALKANSDWDKTFRNVIGGDDTPHAEIINNDLTAPVTNITGAEAGTLEMDVQSNKANDRLAMVHRSLSVYTREGKNKQGREHLTLENEHMLAMLAQQRDKTSVYYAQKREGKGLSATPMVYDKADVNNQLGGQFGVREIDNLNFYLTAGHGGAEAAMQTPKPASANLPKYDAKKHVSPALPPADEQLSLHDYLTFLSRALKSTTNKSEDEITPSVYGVKYEKLLQNMQAQMGIDPQQAFLDSSDVGHRKKFIQAVIVMRATGLVKALQNEATWSEQYQKYHERPPVLRKKTEHDTWVEIGNGEGGYNELDSEYADAFYKPIRDAVLAYTGA